jgi:transcriptional regulator with XRE-family HTH domain
MIDRIKQIMEYYKLSPASFAEQIGINRSNLTHLFSGRNQPSLEFAKKILHCFPEIKTEWLIMGVGNMLHKSEEKELNISIPDEKKERREMREMDLFDSKIEEIRPVDDAPEYDIESEKKISAQIFDSKRDIETVKNSPVIPANSENDLALPHPASTTVAKIVFFYSDNHFEIFYPNIHK